MWWYTYIIGYILQRRSASVEHPAAIGHVRGDVMAMCRERLPPGLPTPHVRR